MRYTSVQQTSGECKAFGEMSWVFREEWVSLDGTNLPSKTWLPKGRLPKAVVILVPGLDGVICDYESIGKSLSQHGYVVYGSELRAGIYDPVLSRRGNIKDWHDWVTDLKGFTSCVQAKHPGLSIFYHGHSLGSLIVMEAAAEAKDAGILKGVILQSVPYRLMPKTENPLLGFVACLFGWWRVDQRTLAAKQPLTGDSDWDRQWVNSQDRLAEGYKVRYFTQALKLGHRGRVQPWPKQMPTLVLKGERDTMAVSDKERTEYDQFIDSHFQEDPQTYKHGNHLLTEGMTLARTKEKALADVLHWLDEQTEP